MLTEGDGESFRLMDHLRPHWKEFAIALRFPSHSIATIQGSNDPLYQLLSEWLREANVGEDTRPVTWKTFIESLHLANIHEEADTLEKHFVLTDDRVAASQFGILLTDFVHKLYLIILIITIQGKRKHSNVEENQAEGSVPLTHNL